MLHIWYYIGFIVCNKASNYRGYTYPLPTLNSLKVLVLAMMLVYDNMTSRVSSVFIYLNGSPNAAKGIKTAVLSETAQHI